jgi:hypothetical protein
MYWKARYTLGGRPSVVHDSRRLRLIVGDNWARLPVIPGQYSPAIHRAPRDDLALTVAWSSISIQFFDVFYSKDVLKSGFHHPDGTLLIRYFSHEHRAHNEKVSLLSIAPAVLEMFDISPPPFMTSPPFTRNGLITALR